MKTEQIPGAITDNILIVESAEASDRKQAIKEMIIEDLKAVRRERDLYFEQLMDAKRRELTNSIKFERLKDIAVSYCQRFEALWDRVYGHKPRRTSFGMEVFELPLPEDLFSYEEMEEYCSHAKFLATCLKREYNIVSLVEEKMKEWKV